MWCCVTAKPEDLSLSTSNKAEIARDHQNNDNNNNNEEQTYGIFCISFMFTQTRLRTLTTSA
jgi:hypothetical protein